MITIYTYTFLISDNTGITMPEDAKILKVGMQNGAPTLWAMIDTDKAHLYHRFRIFGTGDSIPNGFDHVATFEQGPFIWHMFQ